jgi:hypothetical protein
MKKGVWLFIGLLALIGLGMPNKAWAHVTNTDGDISVTIHIDPDDNPVPGEPAKLFFLFSDATKKFQLTNCLCVISISEQGKQLTQMALTDKQTNKPSVWGTSLPYTFPQSGIYHIALIGKPKHALAFQPFKLSWDFRVDPAGTAGYVPQRPSDVPALLGITAGAIIFFVLFGWFIKKAIIDSEEVDNKKKKR